MNCSRCKNEAPGYPFPKGWGLVHETGELFCPRCYAGLRRLRKVYWDAFNAAKRKWMRGKK